MIDHVEIKQYKKTADGKGILFIGQVSVDPIKFKVDCLNAKGQGQLQLDDGRIITALQRKKAWATINDIAEHYGYKNRKEVHEYMKFRYMMDTGESDFSLSDCSISTASGYISFLIELVIAEGIQMKENAMERADDVGRILWLCLQYHRCPLSGLPADIHHVKAIGMGNDRTKIDDSNHEKIALSREYHQEAHKIGWQAFKQKYHVFGIIFNQNEIERKFDSDLFW